MELLTVEEAAAILKVTPSSIYGMTSSRGRARNPHPLPVVRLNSKCLRFRRADIEAWIEQLAKEGQ
jgi:excisionase family DNA binding protein